MSSWCHIIQYWDTEIHSHKSNHDSSDDCIGKLTMVEIKILECTIEKYHDLNQSILSRFLKC